MTTNVSLLTEIPEELHQSLRSYLDSHPTWDQDQIFAVALSLFLQQNGCQEQGLPNHATLNLLSNDCTCGRIDFETWFEQLN